MSGEPRFVLGISIAHVQEFVTDRDGIAYTYDTNTNYDPDAERAAGVSGMDALAELLGAALARAGSGAHRRVRIAS